MNRLFNFCPNCGVESINPVSEKEITCTNCSFHLFINVAAAAGIFLHYDTKILFLKRGRDPAKGQLDIPGGFVDPGENAEEAIRREVTEEIGIYLPEVHYFGSYANRYYFDEINYHTCDIYYECELSNPDSIRPRTEEVESCSFYEVCDIPFEQIGFPCLKQATLDFIEYHRL